jgi:hypothetical protein
MEQWRMTKFENFIGQVMLDDAIVPHEDAVLMLIVSNLIVAGKQVDPVTIAEVAETLGVLDAVGGLERLTAMATECETTKV